MEKKQTAVEWLYSELSKNNISNDSIKSRIYKESEIWKQAKQMEREQMKDVYLTHCVKAERLRKIFEQQFDDYFNENYGEKFGEKFGGQYESK